MRERTLKYYDPDYKCSECGHEIKWEHDGPDYEIHPCKTCLSREFDRGWNECLAHNIYSKQERKGIWAWWQRTKIQMNNSATWVAVGYGAGLLFCVACWYGVWIMLAPFFK